MEQLDIAELCGQVCQKVAQATSETAKALSVFAQKWHDLLYAEYRAAGMPYGDNDEGMYRYHRELGH